MIRVTIWNEFVQEQTGIKEFDFMSQRDIPADTWQMINERSKVVREVHKGAIHGTLKELFEEDEEIEVRHIATLEMPECGLTDEVLADTDVLIWWSHVAQDQVPDWLAERVQWAVLKGMGVIFLHSAHLCKPMKRLLGTSCTLKWREGDFCRIWTTNPTHPIAAGIPEAIELEEEEMYGEFFDIPSPDDVVFTSWFSGGEVFRSGCTWTRGYGRVFYFQPGHETNYSYFNPYIRQILKNAVHWCANPSIRKTDVICQEAAVSPEQKRRENQ